MVVPARRAKGGDGIVVVGPIQPQERVLSVLFSQGDPRLQMRLDLCVLSPGPGPA